MPDHNQGADKAKTANSGVTINSPERAVRPAASLASHSRGARTEKPSNPSNPYKAYPYPYEENAVGNPNAVMSLKLEGQLGLFYPRDKTKRLPTAIDIDFDAIRNAVSRVLHFVLSERADKVLVEMDYQSKTAHVHNIVTYLANGVCVMTYLRLYYVNYHNPDLASRYRVKPEVTDPFEVPAPFALAISQLGAIKISGLPEELYLSPTVPADSDTKFGCSNLIVWSPVVYSKYVLQAKKLGLQFSTVDLEVKLGSSWWLFRPSDDNQSFALQAPYPEENFTVNTAILASLFCNTDTRGFNNPIIDLAPLGTQTFGTFLRKPVADLSVNSFYAITEEKEMIYLYSG